MVGGRTRDVKKRAPVSGWVSPIDADLIPE